LSLRAKLLLAAAGIVAISLILSGALSWVLVSNLQIDNAHLELDRAVAFSRAEVIRLECGTLTATCPRGAMVMPEDFQQRLDSRIAPDLNGDRLLLLDHDRAVVYDSRGSGSVGHTVPFSRSRTLSGQGPVLEGDFRLDGLDYIAAAAPLEARRDPLGAGYVVLARAKVPLEAQAASALLPRLLLAGGLAALLALVITLLLAGTLARPLSELASAAQDIEGGNYARRVDIRGSDEIGLVGNAFNRMAAAVERSRAAQRAFVANVSHELKTPLTSLIGFSQALVDGSIQTRAERERAAEIINEEANRVLRMAQELLDLARVESGQLALQPAAVDLGGLLQQELEVVRPRARARGLVLELDAAHNLPPVLADPERLHQVFDNLLDNAVKYAPQGSTVRIQAVPAEAGVQTSVSNPVGEHRPDPDRMFDRFYRADPSRSPGAGGVGLGLAISRELAAAQRGRLWAELGGDLLTVHLLLPAGAEQRATRPREAPPAPQRVPEAPVRPASERT
jgi:signal transduction histidine kinase